MQIMINDVVEVILRKLDNFQVLNRELDLAPSTGHGGAVESPLHWMFWTGGKLQGLPIGHGMLDWLGLGRALKTTCRTQPSWWHQMHYYLCTNWTVSGIQVHTAKMAWGLKFNFRKNLRWELSSWEVDSNFVLSFGKCETLLLAFAQTVWVQCIPQCEKTFLRWRLFDFGEE